MTLKIAVDNTNVTEFPHCNLMDIAAMSRRFADNIDAGEWPDMSRAVLLVEFGGSLAVLPWGESTTPYELMGLFEAAKLRVFADGLIDDD